MSFVEEFWELMALPLFTLKDQSITVGRVLLTLLVIIAVYLLARLLGRLIIKRMSANGLSQDVIHLVKRMYLVLVLTLISFSILELLNVPLTAFAFVSGAVAIGVGFGAQNIINNFISGWILMWERPIRIGDFIELDDARGVVEAINTRSTRIRRIDGVHMLVPNSNLLENIVVNWTLVDKQTRSSVKVGVAYGSPVREVSDTILQIAAKHPNVLEDPSPIVTFEDFGDSALIFELYFWGLAGGDRDMRLIRSDLRFEIDEIFREKGISIAFPQRDLHLKSATPIEVKIVNPE